MKLSPQEYDVKVEIKLREQNYITRHPNLFRSTPSVLKVFQIPTNIWFER